MAETTSHDAKLSREEVAALLRSIADRLDSGRATVSVPVGNKEVRLSPPDSVDANVTVTERSRRLRKNTEELALRFKWNPTGGTAEAGAGEEAGSDASQGTDP